LTSTSAVFAPTPFSLVRSSGCGAFAPPPVPKWAQRYVAEPKRAFSGPLQLPEGEDERRPYSVVSERVHRDGELPRREALAIRLAELIPNRLMAESRANVVCVQHVLATLHVRAWARRRQLPMLVWTVDDRAHLRHWLRPGAAWMVTSNHPRLALSLRRF